LKSNKIFVGIVASVLLFALFGCGLLYQIKAADNLVKKAISDQKATDQTLEKAADFDSEIDSLTPTEDNASQILSKASALRENVKDAKGRLNDSKKKLKAAKELRLPDWHKKKYIAKLEEAVEKKEDGLKEMEKMLSKTENYGKSIQAWYKGYHNLNQATLNINNITSAIEAEEYKTAADEGEKARSGIKNAQTEFNNAASFANIKMYSDARDASEIYAQMIDPLQQMISIIDELANTPVENLTIEIVNSKSAEIDALYTEIEQAGTKGDAIFPQDIPEDGSIPQSGQDQLRDWRKENIKTFVTKIKDFIKEAEDLDDEARDIRAEEK
jgi:hypothetical protein